MVGIRIHDDKVQFILVTQAMHDRTERGTTRPTRLRSVLDFEISKAEMPTMTAQAVKKLVDPIFGPEAEVSAANTKTIELGQTIDQVEAIFGKPATVAKLADKTIYSYKDMKVVFVNGKVVDVQ